MNSLSKSASTAPTRYASINGKNIAYRTIGEGVPIILCQRFRGNLDDWDPAFIDRLAVHYQIILFDYAGFGLSTGSPANDMSGFASDLMDLAKYLNLTSFIVGGWSFGGAVAQTVTVEYPEYIRQCILLGTRPPGLIQHPPEQIFLERSAKPVNDLDDEIILFFEPSSEASILAAKNSHDRIAARNSDRDLAIGPELWQHYIKGFEDFTTDPTNNLEKIKTTSVPILIISAQHEVVFPPENWFNLNRQLPTAQLIILPQSGHGPHHQYPELIADYIHSFIQLSNNN